MTTRDYTDEHFAVTVEITHYRKYLLKATEYSRGEVGPEYEDSNRVIAVTVSEPTYARVLQSVIELLQLQLKRVENSE